jgi:hypothetical protein
MRSPRPWWLFAPRPGVDLVLDGATLVGVAYAGARGWAGAGALLPYLVLLVALDAGRIAARRRPGRRRDDSVPALWIFRGEPPPGWIFNRPADPAGDPDLLLALRIDLLFAAKVRSPQQIARDLLRGDIA